ncbi:transposase [Pantoea sp. JGM49]|nr:transposase [Pantoea sp. JGM49]
MSVIHLPEKPHCGGHKRSGITLKKRIWQYPECGVEHDQDINAAISIRQ